MNLCPGSKIQQQDPSRKSWTSTKSIPILNFLKVCALDPVSRAYNSAMTGKSDQSDLIAALIDDQTDETVKKALAQGRVVAGAQGIDKVLDEYELDVIVVPGDSPITLLATLAGKYDLNLSIENTTQGYH